MTKLRLSINLLSVLLTTLYGQALLAQLPTIEVTALSRNVAEVGTTFDLRVAAGAYTDELEQLKFTNQHITSQQRTETPYLSSEKIGTGVFRVTVGPQAEPGLCEVRAVGRFGISNPRTFLVTRQPVRRIDTEHTTPSTGSELSPGMISVADLAPQKINYYHLTLKPSEQLRAVVFSKQLDSTAIPTLVLYDAQRVELTRARGKGGWPAEIQYVSKAGGEFQLAVYDFLYRGGAGNSYAMEIAVSGHDHPAASTELEERLRPTPGIDSWSLLTLPSFATTPSPPPIATSVFCSPASLPLHVEGRFASAGPSAFDFYATSGQKLWLEVSSAAMGQLTDPRLLLYRHSPPPTAAASEQESVLPDGLELISEQDDVPGFGSAEMRVLIRDPQFAWTVPHDGLYRAELEDSERGLRPADSTRFRLQIAESRPHFALWAYLPYPSNNPAVSKPQGSNLLRGGTASVRVIALRKGGFSGPIEIRAEDLPEGVHALPSVIRDSAAEASITLHCSEDAPACNMPIHVVGQALDDPAIVANAWPVTVVSPASPQQNSVQSRPSQHLYVGINGCDLHPLSIQLGDESVWEVKQGEKIVVAAKRHGQQVACILRPQDLPPKISLGELTIAADKLETSGEMTVAADAPLGEFTFWLQVEAKVKWRDNPQALQRAEEHLASLKQTLAEAGELDDKDRTVAAIAIAEKRLEALKPLAEEKERTVWFPTNTQRVRIHAK